MSTVKQARQKTIGINPLDHYLSMHQVVQQDVHQDIQQETQQEQAAQENIQENSNTEPEKILEHTQEQIVQQELVQETKLENIHKQEQHIVQTVDIKKYSQDTDDIIAQILQSEDMHMQGPKQRITLHICQELLEKVKNAVFWEPGLTLAGFAHYALEKAVEQLEHERGAPFPDRKTRRLRSGRPLK